MQQQTLHRYFTITQRSTRKTCFVYDPENRRAFFTPHPVDGDRFLTAKAGMNLYLRRPRNPALPALRIPVMETTASVPLLKSNLQKAIRRGHTEEAVQSALALVQRDPTEFLRRLPIIYLEDVCLMDSYPMVVWLMMADKEYPLEDTDVDSLLQIVSCLCQCTEYYPDLDTNSMDTDTPPTTEELQENDILLSVYYRFLYGGMKGDMAMLQRSILYYQTHPMAIVQTTFTDIDYAKLETTVGILEEAIDFHPFPQMLTWLSRQTQLDKQEIKTHLWFVDSGVNLRKSDTLERSQEYAASTVWKKVEPFLSSARIQMMSD